MTSHLWIGIIRYFYRHSKHMHNSHLHPNRMWMRIKAKFILNKFAGIVFVIFKYNGQWTCITNMIIVYIKVNMYPIPTDVHFKTDKSHTVAATKGNLPLWMAVHLNANHLPKRMNCFRQQQSLRNRRLEYFVILFS